MLSCSVLLLALLASTQGRAVNISNTWVLPEEGFPVFYRYFRDRISWYEADAVCQFHHANLVTVDTTAQYDAVRAYLKELDISSAVWVGLIRSNPDGDFTWTDYRGLSGDGYWSAAPDVRAAPLCAAADPAADYRWEARACGGPTVASFICELPVPQWALGNEGCMVRALPALTILYLPESAAVQLTADCGLAGVKRVQCTGNVKREELLKGLSCNEEDELTSTPSIATEGSSTINPDFMTNATDLETSELTTDDDITTKQAGASTASVITQATPIPVIIKEKINTKQQDIINKLNNMYASKNINLDLLYNNNLQSNDIPKLANNEKFFTIEQSEKLEDEKHMHHKMLHDELARHGNFETIFTQPTDHFVPPLVMAKSRISDDMTVLSLAEKHAQQLAEQQEYFKHTGLHEHDDVKSSLKDSTEETKKKIEKPLIITEKPLSDDKDSLKKDKLKSALPKKYKQKYDDLKTKNVKIDSKLLKFEKSTEKSPMPIDMSTRVVVPLTTQITETRKTMSEDNSLELTIILREPKTTSSKLADDIAELKNIVGTKENVLTTESSATAPMLTTKQFIHNEVTTQETSKEMVRETTTAATVYNTGTTQKIYKMSQTETPITERVTSEIPINTEAMIKNIAMNQEVIKITIINDNDIANSTHTVFEVTSLIPELKDAVSKDNETKTSALDSIAILNKTNTNNTYIPTTAFSLTGISQDETVTSAETTLNPVTFNTKTNANMSVEVKVSTESPLTTEKATQLTKSSHFDETGYGNKSDNVSLPNTNNSKTTDEKEIEILNITEIYEIDPEKNMTDVDTIDDYNSPLLSAANEPLHRPNRSRRPQPRNRSPKFNPFRILG